MKFNNLLRQNHETKDTSTFNFEASTLIFQSFAEGIRARISFHSAVQRIWENSLFTMAQDGWKQWIDGHEVRQVAVPWLIGADEAKWEKIAEIFSWRLASPFDEVFLKANRFSRRMYGVVV